MWPIPFCNIVTPIWRASDHTNIHSKSRFWGSLSLWDSNTGISKARLRFPQQALYKLLQENTVCTKSPLYTWASASEDLSASHSWPLHLYQRRSTGETQSFLYFFSLKELWKNKSPKSYYIKSPKHFVKEEKVRELFAVPPGLMQHKPSCCCQHSISHSALVRPTSNQHMQPTACFGCRATPSTGQPQTQTPLW